VNDYNREATPFLKDQLAGIFKSKGDGNSLFDILEASLIDENSALKVGFTTKDIIQIAVTYVLTKPLKGAVINFSISNDDQIIFSSFDTDLSISRLEYRREGIYKAVVQIPKGLLKPGRYFVSFNTGIANFEAYLRLEKCLAFSVSLADENETFISYAERRPGIVAMPLNWETQKI
jgi:lipopolysaccharide transport system ATP-binding protein